LGENYNGKNGKKTILRPELVLQTKIHKASFSLGDKNTPFLQLPTASILPLS